MRSITTGSALLAAVALSSCQTTAVSPAPFRPGPNGSVVHNASGFVFPERVGAFRRISTRQYTPSGEDVSVGYNAGALVVATVYSYPAARSIEAEFGDNAREVFAIHTNAKLLRTGQIEMNGLNGKIAEFTFDDMFPQGTKSRLILFKRSSRFIKYRFSYSRPHAQKAEREVGAFLDTLAWPR